MQSPQQLVAAQIQKLEFFKNKFSKTCVSKFTPSELDKYLRAPIVHSHYVARIEKQDPFRHTITGTAKIIDASGKLRVGDDIAIGLP
jgi:hypothetical protein